MSTITSANDGFNSSNDNDNVSSTFNDLFGIGQQEDAWYNQVTESILEVRSTCATKIRSERWKTPMDVVDSLDGLCLIGDDDDKDDGGDDQKKGPQEVNNLLGLIINEEDHIIVLWMNKMMYW